MRAVDKLVRVFLTDGTDGFIVIHVDVQAGKRDDFAYRMNVYHRRLSDKSDRDVVSLAVLGKDDPNWRPNSYVRDNSAAAWK